MSVLGRLLLPLMALAFVAAPALADPDARIEIDPAISGEGLHYPATRRLDLVEDHFGVKVMDPYRWLEKDVREDKGVSDWVARENDLTSDYLKRLPGRDILRERMQQLYDYGRYSSPRKAGGRYFYTYNSGLQKQSALFVRDGLTGTERRLFDPAGLSKDGTTALAEWEPAPSGAHLLIALQEGGSDWRTLRVLDTNTGKLLDDSIRWVKFSGLAWDARGEGFFYSRFPAPQEGQAYQAANENQAVYYHRLGTPQDSDRLIYATPSRPKLSHRAQTTDDGHWLVIFSTQADEKVELHVAELTGEQPKVHTLVRGLDNDWKLVGDRDGVLWFVTDKRAAKGRLVTLDARRPGRKAKEIVAERGQTLVGGSMVGDRIILAYLDDASTVAELVDIGGKPVGDVPLPGMGTAAGFAGMSGDPETFFSFSSFTMPQTIYRYDTATGQTSVFAQPKLTFDPADFVTEQKFYRSKDGTVIPMFLIRRKDIALAGKPAPTLLYGYGGFNISIVPGFVPTRLAWLEQGGAIAIANLRGGGEYGKAWHDAGRGMNKQNVFDDFIAAAEYLKDMGFTGKDQLAIEGRSNGGLLVGAVVNQRPDLFAAALPGVGVMDMLRFDQFTAGRDWVEDYGSPEVEADFRNLYGYSPYHNIIPGRDYPAILVTTGDTDDRVVPGHSFKYTAALQASDIGPRPHLIRVETNAGHGSGKPIDKLIDEFSDMYAFTAYWTGLKISEVGKGGGKTDGAVARSAARQPGAAKASGH